MRQELLFAARDTLRASSWGAFLEKWRLDAIEGKEIYVKASHNSSIKAMWKAARCLHTELTLEPTGSLNCASARVIKELGRALFAARLLLENPDGLLGPPAHTITGDQVRRVHLFWTLARIIAKDLLLTTDNGANNLPPPSRSRGPACGGA